MIIKGIIRYGILVRHSHSIYCMNHSYHSGSRFISSNLILTLDLGHILIKHTWYPWFTRTPKAWGMRVHISSKSLLEDSNSFTTNSFTTNSFYLPLEGYGSCRHKENHHFCLLIIIQDTWQFKFNYICKSAWSH